MLAINLGSRGLDFAVQRWRESGVRVKDDRNSREAGRDLLEQLEPFSHQRRVHGGEPGDVAAGSREALNETQAHGIDHEDENDRYRPRQAPG